jgi:hypothetical protein
MVPAADEVLRTSYAATKKKPRCTEPVSLAGLPVSTKDALDLCPVSIN